MQAPAFIGDPLSAAGFRLAGLVVTSPARGQEQAALDEALARGAELVLITAEVAARLPQETLGRILARGSPLLLVIPDVRGGTRPPDLAGSLRRQLGVAE